ncbi:MAG: AraC family transcriptional regulator [Megasphaera sp.]|jgi:AraC-like DNA-binding protein|nr:AraC family transcriptional regulator [Megasphaera sp.]MCH4188495.1 AraC family transcriptional regulator [Megasphaera sp.]MCH4218437.1 AraC family transcriptional regulator [Megasphaera sp.]
MSIKEPGVIKRDGIYFWSANPYAKEHLFYLLWGGMYWLDVPYRVKRRYMDAYMIQYIVKGTLHFELRHEHFVAKENELVLLSCQEPNHYWSEEPAVVKWFHFHGAHTASLFDYIYERNGNGHFDQFYGKRTLAYMDAVLLALKDEHASDFQFSHYIYSLLCELAAAPRTVQSPSKEAINCSLAFMQAHYRDSITVGDIAAAAGLSTYYFSRMFKQAMQQSPHVYLLDLRLDNAKKLLVNTSLSMEKIAAETGFQSTSHFIRAFKQNNNMTPNVFRSYFATR